MSEAVKVGITEALYAENIPADCSRETIEAHKAMLLCWGMVRRLEEGRSLEGLCTFCDLSKSAVSAEADAKCK